MRRALGDRHEGDEARGETHKADQVQHELSRRTIEGYCIFCTTVTPSSG